MVCFMSYRSDNTFYLYHLCQKIYFFVSKQNDDEKNTLREVYKLKDRFLKGIDICVYVVVDWIETYVYLNYDYIISIPLSLSYINVKLLTIRLNTLTSFAAN